jgi:hypothetical protein
MKAIAGRLRRLEEQLAPADGKPRLVLSVAPAGWSMSLDHDRLMEILDESGFLPAGPLVVVYPGSVPSDLDAEQAQRFVREHAAEICGVRPMPAA